MALIVTGLLLGAFFTQLATSASSAGQQSPVSNGAEAVVSNLQDTCVTPDGLKLQDQDYEDDQLPWQRKDDKEVVIDFETKNLTPEYLDDMRTAVASWDRSPCIQPRLVNQCEPKTNCVTVSLESGESDDDGNFDSIENNDFTVGGHVSYYVDELAEEGPVATLNVVVHEMGHAVGLRHRRTLNVLMHPDTNHTTEPDEIDYQNLLVLYGQQ